MHLSVLSSAIVVGIPTVSAFSGVTIDASQRYGNWEGWGVSLAWWAKAFGDRDDLASIFFTTKTQQYNGQTLPGLGFNIARYNAGATSHKAVGSLSMAVSPNIASSRQIDGYWLDSASADPASGSWDWSADANQRLMLQKAKANGADTFELFSNSPMWWMCKNHNPSGSDDGRSDNLADSDYRQHAIYLANIDAHARKNWGIDFQSVEAFNEPSVVGWTARGTQEGCHFEVGTMERVIGFLKTELSSRGSEAFIAASDETSYDMAVNTWKAMSGPTKDAVTRINVHGYEGHDGPRDKLYGLARDSSKSLWNSEYGDNDATGRKLAENLLLDLCWLHPTAWVYWQAIDGGGWGLIDGNNDAKTLGAPTTKYFVLAQFARHILPGMVALDAGDNADTAAAYDAGRKLLVIIAANWGDAQYRNFDLARFAVPGSDGALVRRWRTNFDGSKLYEEKEDTHMKGTTFWSWFDTESVVTFEITGVSI